MIEHKSNKINTVAFYVLVITIFLMPWLHGGELLWEHFFFIGSVFIISFLLCLKYSITKTPPCNDLSNINIPIILLSLWIIYLCLQVTLLPHTLIDLIRPSRLPIPLDVIFSNSNPNTISLSPETTKVYILKSIGYILFFLIAFITLKQNKHIILLTKALFFSSAIMAIYSLINNLTNGAFLMNASLMPYTLDDWSTRIRGAFSYPANYASFLLLTIPLGFGLIYHNIKKATNSFENRFNILNILSTLLIKNFLYSISILIMLFALLNTSSRGGNLAFIIATLLTFFSLILQNKTKYITFKKIIFIVVAISLGLFSLLILTGIANNLIDRYSIDGLQFHGREYSNQTSWEMIKDNYIFGTGLGTYPLVSPMYKVFEYGVSVRSIDAHALNDYMEFLAEQGIVGFTIFSTSILYLLRSLFHGLKKSRRSTWGVQIACYYSCLGILVHSIFDFNFQLPVNTIFFFIILALGFKLNIIRNNN